jgi:hypothetical protein
MNSKREQGLFISCCASFCGVLFLIVIWYLRKVNDVEFMKWDIENLTASDFTIEYEITKEMWDTFLNEQRSHE